MPRSTFASVPIIAYLLAATLTGGCLFSTSTGENASNSPDTDLDSDTSQPADTSPPDTKADTQTDSGDQPPPSSITLEPESIDGKFPGEPETFAVTIPDEPNVFCGRIHWRISDPSIAEFIRKDRTERTATIRGRSGGQTELTATCSNGSVSDSSTFQVRGPSPPFVSKPDSDLALWLTGPLIEYNSGTNDIQTWKDLSAHKRDFRPLGMRETDENRPMYDFSGTLSSGTAVFDGNNDTLQTTGARDVAVTGENMTIFVLYSLGDGTGEHQILTGCAGMQTSGNYHNQLRVDVATNTFELVMVNDREEVTEVGVDVGSFLALRTWQLAVFNITQNGDEITVRAFDAQNNDIGEKSRSTPGSSPVRIEFNQIGRRCSETNSNDHLSGRLAEVMIFQPPLKESNLPAILDYFTSRYAPL